MSLSYFKEEFVVTPRNCVESSKETFSEIKGNLKLSELTVVKLMADVLSKFKDIELFYSQFLRDNMLEVTFSLNSRFLAFSRLPGEC